MATNPTSPPAQSSSAPSWWDYEKTLPSELPDTARDALRDKFFQEQEAPWVLQQGFGLESARQQFMKETERPDKASFPRARLVGEAAKAAFTAPLAGMVGDEEAKRSQAESEQAVTEAQREAARQGIHPTPYTMAGEALGQAPYWVGPMKAASGIGAAVEAGRVAQAGLNMAAGAFVQGSYDAAKAPTGNRLLEGAKGALVGAGMVGAFEGLGGLGHALIGSHEMEPDVASAVEKAASGVAGVKDSTKAADAVLGNTDIDKTMQSQVAQAESAAKAAGVPLTSTVGRVNGRVNVLVKGVDGGLYNLGGATGLKPEDFGAMMGRISDHMDQGGSIESLTGDPSAIQKFQNALEEVRKKSFDLALPQGEDIPNDEVKGFWDEAMAATNPSVMFAKGGSTRRDLLKSLASLMAAGKGAIEGPGAAEPSLVGAEAIGTEMGRQQGIGYNSGVMSILRKLGDSTGLFTPLDVKGDFVKFKTDFGIEEQDVTQVASLKDLFYAVQAMSSEEPTLHASILDQARHLEEIPPEWRQDFVEGLKHLDPFDMSDNDLNLVNKLTGGHFAGHAEDLATLEEERAVDAFRRSQSEQKSQQIKQIKQKQQIEQLQRPTGMELQRTHAQLGEEGQGGLMMRWAKPLEEEDKGRIRGSSDLPLDEDGQAHADYLASRIAAKGGFDEIHAADLQRHQQTADAIERTNPMAVRPPANPNLRSMALGGLEGMPHEDAIRAINDLIREAPDTPMPGMGPQSTTPGESVNAFAKRILTEFQGLMDRSKAYPDRKIGAVVSSRDIGMLAAALKKGDGRIPEDLSFDPEEFTSKQENPGDVHRLGYDEDNDKWALRKVDMEADADLGPGVYPTRHAETAWNAPAKADSPWLDVTGATTKETPLYHRVSGDIPFLEESGARGGTVSPFEGVKPTEMFGPEADRDTIFHENLHGHFGYLGMRRWLQTKLLTDPTAQQIAEFSSIKDNYEGFPLPDKLEEVYVHAAAAARVGNEDVLDQFAEADTDKEHLLNWLQDTSESILDKAAEKGDSLHKRVLERRIGAVINRVTSRLDDIDTSFQQGGVSVGYVHGKFAVTEGPDVRYFDDRSSMMDYLEKNHGEPLNAPELVDNSLIADNTPRYARDIPTPNILRSPITTDPPPPETLPAAEGKVSGFTLAGRYFRPFYSWLGDVADKLGRPDLFEAFHRIDKDSIEMANFIRPYTQTIKETLGQYPAKRQSDFYRFFEADAEDKVGLAQEFRFSQKELEDMDTLREKFFDPLYSEFGIDPLQYIQNYAPRIRSGNYDPMELNPRHTSDTTKGMDFFAEHVRTGELDPKDTNLLRVAGTYLRLGARKKFLGDSLDAAAELTDEKTPDGAYRLGLLQTSLKRHIEYMRGVPDYTSKLVNAMAGDAMTAINNGISKVNEFLPGKLQIPEMEATPGEELSKLILFSYAGELALRPALLARDAAQYLLTTLPVLGNYTWTGLRRAFPAIREGVKSDIYKVPQRYGALIERSDLQSMISQGGVEQTGTMENIANKALSFIQWSHNSNRIAAFWGHEAMAQDALESFLKHGDPDQLAKDSGMWFMGKAMRNQFTTEAQFLTGDSDLTDISRRMAKEMVELTQWNFRRGANPGIYEYQLGRLFGQYGTWPLNYIEYARRFATASDKPEAMKALTRLVLTHGAVLSAGQNMGIDLHNWVFTQPMAYGGGPALDILTNIPQSMDFETQRGAEARSEIRRAFFPGVIPGGEAMETVLNAINSDDPNLWMRLMGFTPMEGKERLRGWHQMVP